MSTTTTASRPLLRRIAPLFLVLGLLLSVLTACDEGGGVDVTITDGDGDTAQVETAGFFNGLWDGFISPFTGIAGLFGDVEVYDDDSEGAYPLGFGLGLFLIAMLLLGAITGPRYYRRRY